MRSALVIATFALLVLAAPVPEVDRQAPAQVERGVQRLPDGSFVVTRDATTEEEEDEEIEARVARVPDSVNEEDLHNAFIPDKRGVRGQRSANEEHEEVEAGTVRGRSAEADPGIRGPRSAEADPGIRGPRSAEADPGIRGPRSAEADPGIRGPRSAEANPGIRGPRSAEANPGIRGPRSAEADPGIRGPRSAEANPGIRGPRSAEANPGIRGPRSTEGKRSVWAAGIIEALKARASSSASSMNSRNLA